MPKSQTRNAEKGKAKQRSGRLVAYPELAGITGITERTLRKYAGEGMPHTKGERGAYVFDTARVIKWLIERETESNGDGLNDLEKRAQLADTLTKEFRYEKEMSDFVEADIVLDEFFVFLGMIKAKIRGLGAVCSKKANPENPALARRAIDKKTDEILKRLAAEDLEGYRDLE